MFLSRMLASGKQSADAKPGAQHKGRRPIQRDGSSTECNRRLQSASVDQMLTKLLSCLHHAAKPLVSMFCSRKKPPPIVACFRARASSLIGLQARAITKEPQ